MLSHFSRVRLCVTPWTAATRLPCPWDSPGKNTGVGCHFLLQCMKVKRASEVTQSCPTLSDPMECSLPGSSIHGFSRQGYWSGVPLPSPNFTYRHAFNYTNCCLSQLHCTCCLLGKRLKGNWYYIALWYLLTWELGIFTSQNKASTSMF